MKNKIRKKIAGQNKDRGESNIPVSSGVCGTLGSEIRFKVNGTTLSQEEFFKLHLNGFK
jgi:hypothetical protein